MQEFDIIPLNKENIINEHICCGFSDKKCIDGYQLKKNLIVKRINDGFVFKKFNVRGKSFIEYVPAEYAWTPIEADGYLYIHCFWVSGKFKGNGMGKKLLEECELEAKGKNGIVVVSSSKTKPFLTDKKFFIKQEFEVCDSAPPYFELLVKRNNNAPLPKFKKSVKKGECKNADGLTIYYSNMCPFADYYVNTELQKIADDYNISLNKEFIKSSSQAQNAPTPFTIYSLYYKGKFMTHEILSRKRFDKFWNETMKNL